MIGDHGLMNRWSDDKYPTMEDIVKQNRTESIIFCNPDDPEMKSQKTGLYVSGMAKICIESNPMYMTIVDRDIVTGAKYRKRFPSIYPVHMSCEDWIDNHMTPSDISTMLVIHMDGDNYDKKTILTPERFNYIKSIRPNIIIVFTWIDTKHLKFLATMKRWIVSVLSVGKHMVDIVVMIVRGEVWKK
jgi:hypothetical protein